jgi:hypothetical protein
MSLRDRLDRLEAAAARLATINPCRHCHGPRPTGARAAVGIPRTCEHCGRRVDARGLAMGPVPHVILHLEGPPQAG